MPYPGLKGKNQNLAADDSQFCVLVAILSIVPIVPGTVESSNFRLLPLKRKPLVKKAEQHKIINQTMFQLLVRLMVFGCKRLCSRCFMATHLLLR